MSDYVTTYSPQSPAQSPELAMGLVYAASANAFAASVKNLEEAQASMQKINAALTETAVSRIQSLMV